MLLLVGDALGWSFPESADKRKGGCGGGFEFCERMEVKWWHFELEMLDM